MTHRPLSKTMKIFEVDSNLQDCFRFNSFSENIEYNKTPVWDGEIMPGKPLEDDDITYIRQYLTTIHELEPNKNIIGETCLIFAKKRKYHPVKEYIEKEKWDQKERLSEWMIRSLGCDDNKYIRELSIKFLVAAVNRIYQPGCKFDHMMILEGAQGLGKSTLVEELAGDFFLDTNFDNKDKDLVDSMRKAFLVEISELSGMNKKEIEWLKSFLTRKTDTIRFAYAARVKEIKRKSVFIGTYNPSGNNNYLRDDTGNRRFYPVECRLVNIDYIKKNKHQLWAEAYERYKKNEIYYVNDPESLEILKSMHAERETEGPAYYKIRDWLNTTPRSEVKMIDLIEQGLQIETKGKSPKDLHSTAIIVGIIMKKLGWDKGTNEKRDFYYNPRYKPVEEKEQVQPVGWEE